MAGLATHYTVEREGARYTFYLRGHSSPQGVRLPDTSSLPYEFSQGRRAVPDDLPARWSDGKPITAHDIVYSWRRYVAPETGFSLANYLYCVAGAEDVVSGKLPPEKLGVRALDAYTFQVDPRSPAPHLLLLCATLLIVPLPGHAIEAARARGREASWVEPACIVTSGPFRLVESRPRERIVVAKNPYYYDAAPGGIDGIRFSVADGAVVPNLYRAGLLDSMDGRALPLQLVPGLRRTRGFHARPACANHNWRISTRRTPLDNVVRRYALNMATDKEATARFLGSGQMAARGRVPPLDGYRSPASLPVEINGRVCDVMSFDPCAARELWDGTASAETRAPIPIYHPARSSSSMLAEVLRYQWKTNLGLETSVRPMEIQAYGQMVFGAGEFTGVAEDTYIANYPDPSDPLQLYAENYPNWSDAAYDRMLAAARSTADPQRRMEKLAECETSLLLAMPFIPLYFDTWNYLEKPDVHGLELNPFGVPFFKYAWIDSHRREP